MSDRKITYLSRTFEDYRQSLIDYTREYYPEIADRLNDASIGSWLIDLISAVGDNLSYYIDKTYNETNLDSAQLRSSVMSLARSNGLRVPGPKGAVVELQFSCELPPSSNEANSPSTLGSPNWKYAPVIKKRTRVMSTSGQYFELNDDVDFTEQFDVNGNSNRTILPMMDSNRNVAKYTVRKTCFATAGIRKIYKMSVSSDMIKPFMEIIIPDNNVMEVESIILKDGYNFQSDPCMEEFMMKSEFISASDDSTDAPDMYRFFEVESLSRPYRWGDSAYPVEINGYEDSVSKTYEFGYVDESGNTVPSIGITRGEWKPVTQKFVTEFTDNGYLKIIFGGGSVVGQDVDITNSSDFTKYQVSKFVRNDFLGKLPKAGTTMFILYRVGGGNASNVPKDTINKITYLNAVNKEPVGAGTVDRAKWTRIASDILNSITVTNTIPSVAGKDAPTVDEIRAMIKYNSASQERCVTVKDYENRVLLMPSRYGNPFRISAIEVNNKIMLYMLMVDTLGHLSASLPSVMIENIEDYLSKYRSVNDYVEIKSGRIVNLSFDVDIYADKNYNTENVVYNVIDTIKGYMDINKHLLGEDIYVSDLEKEITKIDGVLNLIDMRVFNEYGSRYSSVKTSQAVLTDAFDYDTDEYRDEIDLSESDYILNSEYDEMFEIKYPENDIRVRVKTR